MAPHGARAGMRPAGPDDLVVSEVFGPTLQGEGRSLGRRAGFVRLGNCNLDCGRGPGSTWACDTPHTWDWKRFDPDLELTSRSVADLVAEVASMGVDRVVLTGGEPLIQQRRLLPLLRAAAERGWAVEVETNGTIAPLPPVVELVAQLNVSPKVSGSGVPPEKALRGAALEALRDTGKAIFKFVAAAPEDLDEIAEVVARWRLAPVMIMPAGTNAEDLLRIGRDLADPVLQRGWDLTTRLHILLWGDVKGR